ncbi:25436_t:CDS:2, partial [Dentiscutata erythropus]
TKQTELNQASVFMNTIATNTSINLDNRRLITNHSCHHTAIQLLKNQGLSNSDLQLFLEHRSHESLGNYYQTSDNQHILNTAMLFPFTSQELNLNKYEDYDDQVPTAEEILVSMAQENQISTAQENQAFMAQENQVPMAQEI